MVTLLWASSGCGGIDVAIPVTPPPRESPSPTPTPAGPSADVVQGSLLSPSGIWCALLDGDVFGCTMTDYDFAVEPCDPTPAPFITLAATGIATMTGCVGDRFAHASKTPTAAGTVVKLGNVVCDVEVTSVACTNPEGHGFMLNKTAFSPF